MNPPHNNISEHPNEIDWFEKTKILKQNNPKNLTCAYLNINSIRNKLDHLFTMINNNIDIICISETKLDSSFPVSQFKVPGYSLPHRKDFNSKSGGMLVYINESITGTVLEKLAIPSDLHILPIEINLRKSKWLIIPIYKHPSTNDEYFLQNLNRVIEFYSCSYENILTLGDFNLEPTVPKMSLFIKSNDFYSLNKKPTMIFTY